ncbi:unnamed protein product [Adineta steineri]|uniref:non-specific serine/threonine protein kinase n=2 Tax=Adineta steineri TaxID=433720 RepID=A0A815JQ97_9BILA|nr:unnamed protein product [Adineta steineri]CAF1607564.1 unnamed protein product [Adineta steineri]
MSFQVETTPNHYVDYEIFSSTRFNQLGQQFLSLINPKHGTTPNENEPVAKNENEPVVKNETEPIAKHETEPVAKIETEPVAKNLLQQPSDLCRPQQEQTTYYLANQDVIKQIKDNFLPHKSVYPYTPPSLVNNNDEQLTTSLLEWQTTTKQTVETIPNLSSQIITIVQCRLKVTSALSTSSERAGRHAIRLFIDSQQPKPMDAFLDIVNEALLLDLDTIKTLWDVKGEQITDPMDLLRHGRLYFASREEEITFDELDINDSELASINRLETVRNQLSQPAYFVEKPTAIEKVRSAQSRKSTSFNGEYPRSSSGHGQNASYTDLQTFPEVFLRHYTVGDVVGDGRFSSVYECRDKATGIQLALKIIDKTRCEGYGYLIENELSILRRVKHPYVIKLVEEFQTEFKYFLVFEYVSNGDLLTAITTMNKYSEHDVALMLSQIASALKHIHSLEIVHRDVKLENILIANHPDHSVTLKLADFGLALCLTDPKPTISPNGNDLCGTPMYIAPEVIQNRDYRVENDMWSLGIIAFTLLSGMAPFDGDTDDEIIANVINKTIDFNLLPKISAECQEAVTLMLERDINKRISAAELLEHPWIKREMQKRVEPVSNTSSPRRPRKVATQKQPMLTFSSVDHPHSFQSSKAGGLMSDIDEL